MKDDTSIIQEWYAETHIDVKYTGIPTDFSVITYIISEVNDSIRTKDIWDADQKVAGKKELQWS